MIQQPLAAARSKNALNYWPSGCRLQLLRTRLLGQLTRFYMLLKPTPKRIGRARRNPSSIKSLYYSNLNLLAQLAGFTDEHNWDSSPTCTLRFAEILAKLYASRYTVGELQFLFTVKPHVHDDDPFPISDKIQSLDDPFNLPEDSSESLWRLRRKLLSAEVDHETIHEWTWSRIEDALLREFGYSNASDLFVLADHFFPFVLRQHGFTEPKRERLYRVSLPQSDTTPSIWQSGPFQYHNAASELCIELPLEDRAVLDQLSHIRQLKPSERLAVSNLYYAPRLTLVPFALIFPISLKQPII